MGVTLTIVRHGNSFEQDEPLRRIGARTDLPLVESGRVQALALGTRFAAENLRFDRTLASPLRRTLETARLILSQAKGPAIEIADWLTEIDHGPDEGRDEDEVKARLGEAALAAWDARGIVPPGWDVDVPGRIAAWRRLYSTCHQGPDTQLLIVTSNGAARFALAADAALTEQALALGSPKLRTGAWGRIVVDGSALRLVEWDRRP